jgi:hypothetical protein
LLAHRPQREFGPLVRSSFRHFAVALVAPR